MGGRVDRGFLPVFLVIEGVWAYNIVLIIKLNRVQNKI